MKKKWKKIALAAMKLLSSTTYSSRKAGKAWDLGVRIAQEIFKLPISSCSRIISVRIQSTRSTNLEGDLAFPGWFSSRSLIYLKAQMNLGASTILYHICREYIHKYNFVQPFNFLSVEILLIASINIFKREKQQLSKQWRASASWWLKSLVIDIEIGVQLRRTRVLLWSYEEARFPRSFCILGLQTLCMEELSNGVARGTLSSWR